MDGGVVAFGGARATLRAWLTTTLIYALLQAGLHLRSPALWRDGAAFALLALGALPQNILTAGSAAALAFVARELARRRAVAALGGEVALAARGKWLALAALAGLFGVFVAPPLEARYAGFRDDRLMGRAALAAPAANIILAIGWFALLSAIVLGRVAAPGWFAAFGYAGFLIDAWLALAALIPRGPFDGAAILRWSRAAYGAALALALLLAVVLSNEDVLQFLLKVVQ